MRAYIFPGQGSQFSGMGKNLYENPESKKFFDLANKILGFDITRIMFSGTAEELGQTKITQLAVFIHSVIRAKQEINLKPDMLAGHSLGEFSALTVGGGLSYEDGLVLVHRRAKAMQKACETNPSGMAAILGLKDKVVDDICSNAKAIVVAVNYNSPGQVVISGTTEGLSEVYEPLTKRGGRFVKLPVRGAFHSPLMKPAQEELEDAILKTSFSQPICPIYQNIDALSYKKPDDITQNLIKQLVNPVRWSQTIHNMIADGADHFIEYGPGRVLSGLMRKIDRTKQTENFS